MKKSILTTLATVLVLLSYAQLGIGTTSPNSTLDVRGSISTSYRAFTASTTATATDNLLVFTGTTAATLTLPTAVGCDGRTYMVKNASTTGPTPVLTITTTSSQTIDAATSWTLTSAYETITIISNGSNWNVSAQSLPGGSGVNWTQNGNSVASQKSIGTISNHSLPFITNNTEKMRLTNSGNLGIGTSTFNATHPEKLVVDAGTTTSVNAIVGKGSIDNYLQLNIQNNSAGTNASSDVVATANNGSETTNFIDMGINGGGNTSGVMGTANDGYLYNIGQNLLVGTGTAAKSLVFMTGGTSQATNERMRINGSGNVGIGNNNPAQKLDVTGNLKLSGAFMPGGVAGTSGQFLISAGAGSAPTWPDLSGSAWLLNGNSVASLKTIGTTSAFDLPFITNNTEKMRLTSSGNLGVGTSTFNATNPEKLVVDAGTTTSVNAIVGKGSIDSYLQLNIQNNSSGTNASSDVVATANNGSETTNYIDMGINGGNNSSGVMGAANDGYLYNIGQNLLIGTGTAAKSLIFMTGGTNQASNERMRINGSGLVGIGNNNPTSTLSVTGSTAYSITTKTANYTASANDYSIVCNNTGAITISLPAASGATGRVYVIKKISAALNNVTIDPNSSETIDGSSTRVLTLQYESVMIQCDGSSRYILSKN